MKYIVQYDWDKIVAGIKDKNLISKLLNPKISSDFEKKIDYGILSTWLENNNKQHILQSLCKTFENLKNTDKIDIDCTQLDQALAEEQEVQEQDDTAIEKLTRDALINAAYYGNIAQQIAQSNPKYTSVQTEEVINVDKGFELEYQNMKQASNFQTLWEYINTLVNKITKALEALVIKNNTLGEKGLAEGFKQADNTTHIIQNNMVGEKGLIQTSAQQPKKANNYDYNGYKERQESRIKIDELTSINTLLYEIKNNKIVAAMSSCGLDPIDRQQIDAKSNTEYQNVINSGNKASLIENFEKLLNAINQNAKELQVAEGDIIFIDHFKQKLKKGLEFIGILESIEGKNFSEIQEQSDKALKDAKEEESLMANEAIQLVKAEHIQQKTKQNQQQGKAKSPFTQYALKRHEEKKTQDYNMPH